MSGRTNTAVPGPWAARARAFANLSILALPVFMISAVLLVRGDSIVLGVDFRGVTPEIQGLLHGTNPYVAEGMQEGGHFLWTVLGGWVLAPLAWLPGGWAVMMALELVGIVVALRLLRVSDWRMYALALAWPATTNSLQTANITVLLVVLIAAGWRERANTRAGLWLGLAVAVKLFAWPVLVWVIATRRWRALALAAGIQALGVLLTLPYVSLADFARYQREADRVFSDEAVTPYALLLGWDVPGARMIAVAAGLCLLAWGRRDLGWCVVAALALSPILWLHYFDLLLVPLALWSAPLWVWFVPFGLWVTPGDGNGGDWRTIAALLLVAATVIAANSRRQGPR